MRAAWLTDPHLTFLDDEGWADLGTQLAASEAAAVVVSGDLATAPHLHASLERLCALTPAPVAFVLGNHDYYHSAIATTRAKLRAFNAHHPRLRWLSDGAMQLSPHVWIAGVDGWGDGRLGNADSAMQLNDFHLIEELANARAQGRLFEQLAELGAKEAERAAAQLVGLPASCRVVIFVTHVPPFKEASWHQGELSDDEALPFFVCAALGEVLTKHFSLHHEQLGLVLCGHTHSAGEAWPLPNLRVLTGAARYGVPQLMATLEIDAAAIEVSDFRPPPRWRSHE